jgi:hypothetical protein
MWLGRSLRGLESLSKFADGVVVEAVEDLRLDLKRALREVLGGGGDLLGDLRFEFVAQFFHALGFGAFPVVDGLLGDAGEFACPGLGAGDDERR